MNLQKNTSAKETILEPTKNSVEEQLKQNPDYQKLPILEQKIIKAKMERMSREAERIASKEPNKKHKPKKSL